MAQRYSGDPARRGVLGEMVDVLEESPELADTSGRQQWRRELSGVFDGLALTSYPTPRQELFETLRVCCELPGGLDELVKITHLLAPALTHRLRPLLDEWNAVTLYGERDWSALRRALDVSLPELNAIVAEVCGDRFRLPQHCATAWDAFTHLACRNALPGTLHPSMELLEHLALHADLASRIGELHAWNEFFASLWEVAEGSGGLLEFRSALAGARAVDAAPAAPAEPERDGFGLLPERPVIRLFVSVTPDLTPMDAKSRRSGRKEARYRLSSRVLYAESAGLHQEPDIDPREPAPRSRVPLEVAGLLQRMSELWQSRAEEVVLEFFLPTELLNEPIEWWNRNPQLGYANPLLSKYHEIFVHSLERMQRRELHHAWRARWARWKSRPDAWGVHWCDAGEHSPDEHLARLDAQVGKDDEVAAMVLSEPPRSRGLGLRELRLGLDLGIPVLIHHREDNASESFRSVVKEGLMADGGLAKLPARAREWKSDCAAGGTSMPEELVRHLSVIWDNPEQLLDGGPLAPANFVGGID